MEQTYYGACFDEWDRLLQELIQRMDRDILGDGGVQSTRAAAYVAWAPCPENIGNDPCDDWDYTDYDDD